MIPRSTQPRRALGLDALRGLAILGMVLSARIPFGNAEGIDWLPGWMYHAQEGVNPSLKGPHPPGLTWVDLVFPMFLFAMGVAFPFALSRRLERGASRLSLIPGILWRFALLTFFAFYLQHTIPFVLGGSDAAQGIGLLAFALLFPIFTRFPRTWSPRDQTVIRMAGWIAAVALLAVLRYPDGSGFSLARCDIIILVLANMALVGSLIWLITQTNWPARLAFLVLGLLGHFSMGGENHITLGLGELLAPLNQIPLVHHFAQLLFFKYLIIVLPGTVIGDLLLAWMRRPQAQPSQRWGPARLWSLAALMTLLVVWALIGYQARWSVATPLGLAGLSAVGFLLVRGASTDTERLLRAMFLWASVWLALGMLTEPLEGGVKKTPSTLSYYFLPLALSIHMLIALTAVIDVLGHRRWGWGLLVSNGQNPMIAYAGIRGILGPVYQLTRIDLLITQPLFQLNAWLGALWGLFKTWTLAIVVHLFTRLGILWRS